MLKRILYRCACGLEDDDQGGYAIRDSGSAKLGIEAEGERALRGEKSRSEGPCVIPAIISSLFGVHEFV